MKNYLIRLDDASEYMDVDKWSRMEELLDCYSIKPIVGIIPKNEDPKMKGVYEKNGHFWDIVNRWIKKGWTPAMHGYEHRYVSEDGGINPVNHKSEFAGLPYEEQRVKIREGYRILLKHDICPELFFAPSHTFDEKTMEALFVETSIRVISDTIAWDVYKNGTFWFIPQQSGRVRALPFETVTFCYHPNTMNNNMFEELEEFIDSHKKMFRPVDVENVKMVRRGMKTIDYILKWLYYRKR